MGSQRSWKGNNKKLRPPDGVGVVLYVWLLLSTVLHLTGKTLVLKITAVVRQVSPIRCVSFFKLMNPNVGFILKLYCYCPLAQWKTQRFLVRTEGKYRVDDRPQLWLQRCRWNLSLVSIFGSHLFAFLWLGPLKCKRFTLGKKSPSPPEIAMEQGVRQAKAGLLSLPNRGCCLFLIWLCLLLHALGWNVLVPVSLVPLSCTLSKRARFWS